MSGFGGGHESHAFELRRCDQAARLYVVNVDFREIHFVLALVIGVPAMRTEPLAERSAPAPRLSGPVKSRSPPSTAIHA